MTKAPTPTGNPKKQRDHKKKSTKISSYTTIADRLRAVSLGNDSHPTGVVQLVQVYPVYMIKALEHIVVGSISFY